MPETAELPATTDTASMIPRAIRIVMAENACGAAAAAQILHDRAASNRLSEDELAATIVAIRGGHEPPLN